MWNPQCNCFVACIVNVSCISSATYFLASAAFSSRKNGSDVKIYAGVVEKNIMDFLRDFAEEEIFSWLQGENMFLYTALEELMLPSYLLYNRKKRKMKLGCINLGYV